jgi:PAS domain S-box-containing protein
MVKRIVTEESEELYEATFLKKDGSEFDAEVYGKMFDYHGRRVRVAAIRDITERKRAEEELKLSEARFEALYQLSQMTGVPMTELSAFVLERAVELTKSKVGFIGFMDESEETLTVHAWSRHAMDECKINEKPIHFPISKAGIWAETIRQRKPIIINDYETTGEPKKGLPDGHVELSSLLSVPVLEGERIAALAAVGNKETEYDDADVNQLGLLLSGMLRYYQNKRAADELSSEKSKLESLVGGIKAGLVVLDPEVRVIWSNDLFQTWFGPLEDIKDLYCYELFRLRNPEEECAALRAMRSGEVEKGESFAYTIGGEERYFQLTTAPVIDKDGKIVQLVELVQDITDHKRLEEELVKHRDHLEEIVKERTAELLTAYRELEREVIERAKAESQLRQSQKMEAVGQLAGGIAHDFNNRLFAIRNYAHILKATEEEGSALETIEKLIVSCDRAAQLVDDLLKFSREKAINPKPIDVSVIVREAHSILEIAAGKEVEFTMNLSSEPLQVMADASNMEHVLLNLVNNARDVMPEGGKISISTERVEADSVPDDALDGGRACPCALILVSDTGPGLQEDTKDKIFDPFFTTKEIGKGTGLGLAIVYGVVKQHGGFVDVASEPGKGTTFRIFLPLLK